MKILSWNINGLISWIENQSYRSLEELALNVVCLQEIRTQRRLTALLGYCHYRDPCERDGLHGTMTLTKQELPEDTVFELETHFKYIIEKYDLHLE